MAWQPIETAPMDGTEMVLHVDWEPLSVVGFYGAGSAVDSQNSDPRKPLYDNGLPTWPIEWDGSPIHWGFDEPTHWMPLPPRRPRRPRRQPGNG